MLVLIGPQALGHTATTSKVRYTSNTAGKCRPTSGMVVGQKVRETKKGHWQQICFRGKKELL